MIFDNAIKNDVRICFSISWFATEQEADEASAKVKQVGLTYNGGVFHGRPCGRDRSWDKIDPDTGKGLYAVTS